MHAQRVVATLVAATILLTAAGCGSDRGAVRTDGSTTTRPTTEPSSVPTTPTTEVPTRDRRLPADQVVWQASSGGGLRPVASAAGDVPAVTLYGDGRIFVAAPDRDQAFDHPIPVRLGHVDPAALAAFVAEVEASGLFDGDPVDLGSPSATDGITTTATFGSEHGAVVVSAYFLESEFDDGLSTAQVGRRRALRALIGRAASLATTTRAWVPDRVRVTDVTAGDDLSEAGAAAPWSGPAFASFLTETASGTTCGELRGEAAADAFAAATANPTVVFSAGGEARALVVAALLPGEPACAGR